MEWNQNKGKKLLVNVVNEEMEILKENLSVSGRELRGMGWEKVFYKGEIENSEIINEASLDKCIFKFVRELVVSELF